MNDNAKTITFVAVAAAVLLIAWVARPSLPVAQRGDMEGKPLFEEFKDPLAAASLEIVQYDESTATVRPFKVAQVKGKWSIPSHENYPTDAKDQLASAASALMDLKVMRVQSENPGDHAEYGVIDPSANPNAGTTGVGMRVVVRDKDDKELLGMVIGKEVPDRSGLRYVRRVGQDPVYVVSLSTDKLSSKFEDWIEKDLLKISSWDVKGVQIQDYTVVNLGGGQLAMDPRSRMAIQYSDTDPKWKLDKYELFDKAKSDYKLAALAPDEELNASKLDTMKTALDELKIVDVARKPEGLSKNLKAEGQLTASREAFQSLKNRGFYLVPVGNSAELLSNKGEMRVLMKDGVEYVLRFGEIAGAAAEEKAKDKKDEKKEGKKEGKKDEKKPEESTGPGVNRYLFIMAEFNQDALPKPQLEALPKEEKTEPGKSDAKKDETKKDDAKKGDKSSDKKDEKKDLKAERERIEKENKRKQDEYDQNVKKGQDRVKELNGRFAAWYYVIGDDVYKKIHLTRDDIVKKKEKKEEKKDAGKKDEAKDSHEGHDHAAPEAKKDAPAAAPKDEKKAAPDKPSVPEKKDSPAAAPPGPKKDAAPQDAKKTTPPAGNSPEPAKGPEKPPAAKK